MFGMGTGVTLPTKSPENRCDFGFRIADFEIQIRNRHLRKNCFGSGDPAVRRASRFRLAQPTGQSPRYGTFEISDLRSEISESNSDQGKSASGIFGLQIPDAKLKI